MEMFRNSQAYEVQLLQMELPQVATFSNIIDLLKVMFLIMHIYSDLKSLDYEAITIEFVNYLPTKSTMRNYLSFVLSIIHWDNLDNCKVWTKRLMVMFGASCKLVTLKFHLDRASEQQKCLAHLCCHNDSYPLFQCSFVRNEVDWCGDSLQHLISRQCFVKFPICTISCKFCNSSPTCL